MDDADLGDCQDDEYLNDKAFARDMQKYDSPSDDDIAGQSGAAIIVTWQHALNCMYRRQESWQRSTKELSLYV
ncbi:conserved hypothetical protein [Ricinus communis]|uniref:Uncharacterized protein n=1 Tax=Ricinus communis TaxID=3988 RepID=B9RJY8_RICCO|nr:conserved hypothetical protein [Ricinus communis]